jgi:hypothetical protein
MPSRDGFLGRPGSAVLAGRGQIFRTIPVNPCYEQRGKRPRDQLQYPARSGENVFLNTGFRLTAPTTAGMVGKNGAPRSSPRLTVWTSAPPSP